MASSKIPAKTPKLAAARPAPRPAAKKAAPAPTEFRVVQTRRTFEEVTAQVREMLFDGSLRAGDRLPPERELSKMLGVGRPALREALRALEVSGLIELRKGKTGGAFISTGNMRAVTGGVSDMLRLRNVTVEELFEAREWILSALIRPACRRITAAEVRHLRDNVAMAEQLHAQGRYEERIDANFEFYGLLAEATRNPVAVVVIRGSTDVLRSLIHAVGSDLSPNFFGNRLELLKALEARDEDAAVRVMTRIVKATEQTYKRLVEERMGKKVPKAARSRTPVVAEPARKKSKSA